MRVNWNRNGEVTVSAQTKKSLIILLLANTIPLFGVLFFDWSLGGIIQLYWAENVIIGMFNVVRMLQAEGPVGNSSSMTLNGRPYTGSRKLSLITFFVFHYGIFTAVHGVFVFAFFAGRNSDFTTTSFVLGFVALLVSHLLSYLINFIGAGEYKRVNESSLFFQPYMRVVVLHVTIIFGAAVTTFLGSPMGALIVLILIKSAVDSLAHIYEHYKQQSDK